MDVGISITDMNESRSFLKLRNHVFIVSVVLLFSFIVYIPSLENGYVNWDDQANIYNNPIINTISGWESFLSGAIDIFKTHVEGNYNPLVILSFAFEKIVFGLDNPVWLHLNNIILHLVCVFLVYCIVLTLGLNVFPAAFCALIFGIHPMRVESVAWITERKDLLYGLFFLLSFYYYIKSVKSSFSKRYSIIILVSFVLALLSKIQAVTLPLSMLLVDYYFGRKMGMKLIFEKWHYFLLSLITGIVGIYFIREVGGIASGKLFSFFDRLFIGSYSYLVFLIKSVVPYEMVPVYAYPASLDWLFYASIVPVLGIISLTCYSFTKGKKFIVFGLLFFTVNIMFMLQIFGVGQGFLADRFTYIAYLGIFYIYAYGVQWLLEKHNIPNLLIYTCILIMFCIFGYMNFKQNKIWKNGETLWSHVLDYNPSSSAAWANRANYYDVNGQTTKAIHDFSKAISLNPNDSKIYHSRANTYLSSDYPDKFELALQDFNRALLISPGIYAYLVGRGYTFLNLGMLDSSLSDFNAAEELNPADHEIFFYRSRIFYKLGQYDKAQQDIEKYLSIKPENAAMWSNLGMVARLNNRLADSLKALDRAIQLNPKELSYYYKRSVTYYAMGKREQARNDLNFVKSRGFTEINKEFEKMLLKQ